MEPALVALRSSWSRCDEPSDGVDDGLTALGLRYKRDEVLAGLAPHVGDSEHKGKDLPGGYRARGGAAPLRVLDGRPPEDTADQTGRTALITGANSGIGLETARVLAAHGARVVLSGRDAAKLEEAVRSIRASSLGAKLETLVLDLADLASVRAAAKQVADTETVDLLINNAGVMNLPQRQTTRDGFETTFGTPPVAARLLMGSPEGAAWPSLYAATNPDVRSGQFIGPASRKQTAGTPKPVRLPKGADDPEVGAWLWAESERLTGVTFTP